LAEGTWTWGSIAPDEWFADRTSGSLLVRGYLTARSELPEGPEGRNDDALWTYTFRGGDFAISVRSGSFEVPRQVPRPIEMRYIGGGNVTAIGAGVATRIPPGVYVILSTPIDVPLRGIGMRLEQEAAARLDVAAGLVAATLSPNAVYLTAFEFFQAASGSEVKVMGPKLRNPTLSPATALTEASMRTIKGVLEHRT
jgi:hypothetical protein